MNVLSVAYPLLPVGPDAGGGAEQILSLIDRGITERKHRSIVIGAKGSTVAGEWIESPVFEGEMTEEVRERAQREHLRLLEETLARDRIDVIHFHGLDFFKYVPSVRVPKVTTLHLPCSWYPQDVLRFPKCQLVCVSDSQARSAPTTNGLKVIPNGIDTGQYAAGAGERKHLIWLGRVCPEKGVHIALEIAHELDLPLLVAGPVHPLRDHEMYFAEKVQPLLDNKRQYVGAVGLCRKKQLLAEAICLLNPSLVQETSSLVAMEAISSGTPVVAFRTGALPEIVEEGVTGFLVNSKQEMAEAVARTVGLSSERCRERAEARFDAGRMVDDYLKLYASQ
ncbi:MAG: glycosyltransferase family 4 protein [Acidobacteriaceae bacterium]|nr:glycosyltransferase family 4 protein [Acidobacteriaceae bacterium]